jgi:NADPH-dependent glutamate synthase beta subunit-like oxidoreductase/glutamate synthase domain-containing protein 3/Pyruvate/2-oxoacid:ferredoxin oxidoreductase delta subunit
MRIIKGTVNEKRISSRVLEEEIHDAVQQGQRKLHIFAQGQHGIGGRIWPREEKVEIIVEGPVGQRLGSMGMYGTEIVVRGSVSDDVGWLNCGAKITVLSDVSNGAHNAGAQGILYVQGGGGARCDTMTKFNPRFEPLQSWYFRDVGDSFAEFKAGGIAVICGVNPRNPNNIIGYRPCVGMVGGTIYFRGHIGGFSDEDVKCVDLTPQDWDWLKTNMRPYLEAIDRVSYYDELTRDQGEWKKLIAYTPTERTAIKGKRVPISEFRRNNWETEVGKGGIFGEYIDHPLTLLPYITTGVDRRLRPEWNNHKYLPPCAFHCPSRIPSHRRASLIRQGRMEDALALVLQYSPLPATVCGQVCPNLCMEACTRGVFVDKPLNIKALGSLSLNTPAPKRAAPTGQKVAIIGGGPAGLSAAWQLGLKGHDVDLYETSEKLGGKIEYCIPKERLPQEILQKELDRFGEIGVKVHLNIQVDRDLFDTIYKDHEIVIIAIGAHQPRVISFKGIEDVVPGIVFLKDVNYNTPADLRGKKVVIIGAGNVGMDIASEAFNCGASEVTSVDIQTPASFGKERQMAEAKGTKILYPKITERYSKDEGRIYFTDGTSMETDMVILSIGEIPILDFLPPGIDVDRHWVKVNEFGQTSDPKVFAIGDAVKPGLITNAIGQGRITADAVHAQMMSYDYVPQEVRVIPYEKIKTNYYESCKIGEFSAVHEAGRCMSCGLCIDCHMCEITCHYGAISRIQGDNGDYEYVVDDNKCIGCGFCAGVCPCGIWEMVENI